MNELWDAFIETRRGRVTGALTGLILGIIILCIGLWRFLVLAAFVAVGWFIGSRGDRNAEVSNLLDGLFHLFKFGKRKDD